MTDEESNKISPLKSSAWESIVEGGLPQLLAGPAGKALSRLLGAVIEIPSAYFESIEQGIRDNSEAKSIVSRMIAQHVAVQVSADPSVIERAQNTMLAKSIRAQTNKDEVTRIVVEDLNVDPPAEGSEGPSDEWLDKFERHAEEASSDELRQFFGKILTGELRKPGSVSLATMHMVSVLDSDSTQLIRRV